MIKGFSRKTALCIIVLATASCHMRKDDTSADGDPDSSRASAPEVVFVPPTIRCIDGSTDVVVEFSSSNGQPSYQPSANQCVKITDASGELVLPYKGAGDPYLTPVYTSPPLSLTPGATYMSEIVWCTGGHAYPGKAPFPYTNAILTAPKCAPDSGRSGDGGGSGASGASNGSGGCDTGKKGMTWGKYGVDPITGVLQVGCQPIDGSGDCNAYHGDTSCTTPLPILCKNPLALPQPATFTVPPDSLHQWSGNVVATTPPVAPATANLNSRAAVNAYCAAQFGAGWEVAEFHDGWGWNFTSYGNVGPASRFWVDINDQPDGNCW
jgi:hypothetical protein